MAQTNVNKLNAALKGSGIETSWTSPEDGKFHLTMRLGSSTATAEGTDVDSVAKTGLALLETFQTA